METPDATMQPDATEGQGPIEALPKDPASQYQETEAAYQAALQTAACEPEILRSLRMRAEAAYKSAEFYANNKYPNAMLLLVAELDDLTCLLKEDKRDETNARCQWPYRHDDETAIRIRAEQNVAMAMKARDALLQGDVIPAIKRVQRYIDERLFRSQDRHKPYGVIYGRMIDDRTAAAMKCAIRELIYGMK